MQELLFLNTPDFNFYCFAIVIGKSGDDEQDQELENSGNREGVLMLSFGESARHRYH